MTRLIDEFVLRDGHDISVFWFSTITSIFINGSLSFSYFCKYQIPSV